MKEVSVDLDSPYWEVLESTELPLVSILQLEYHERQLEVQKSMFDVELIFVMNGLKL